MRHVRSAKSKFSFVGIWLVALGVLVAMVSGASAHHSPALCSDNGLSLTLGAGVISAVERGGTVPYRVTVANTIAEDDCDVDAATVTLRLPNDTDGTSTGGTLLTVAGPGATFLADPPTFERWAATFPPATDAGHVVAGMTYTVPLALPASVDEVRAASRVIGAVHLPGGHAAVNVEKDLPIPVVDANIAITGNGTNEVGVVHTFTVEVNKDPGAGGFVDATDGHVDVTLTGSNGIGPADIQVQAGTTCDVAGVPPHTANNLSGTGTCIVVFKSDKPGLITGEASVSLVVTGLTLTRDTKASTVGIGAGNGGSETPAVKRYVDADIKITGNGTNEVGVLHTFTVEVNQNDGTGGGYVDAPTGHVDVTLTGSNGILAGDIVVDASSTCHTAGAPHVADNLAANGTCIVVFKSDKPGQINGDAKVVLDVAGVTLTRDTDPGTVGISNGTGPGAGGSDVDAIKKYVDADIKITGNGTNEVGVLHTFTVEVNQNDGTGGGYVDAPTGHVDVTLTGSNGILAGDIVVDASSTCHTAGAPHVADNLAANGTCIVVFKSDKPGQINGDAKVVLDVAGVTLTRDTDPATAAISNGAAGSGGSDTDAIKRYVDADIKITGNGTNEVGVLHTFTVEVNQNDGTGGGYVDAPTGHVDVTLTGSNGILAGDIVVDASSTCHTAGAPHVADNLAANGTCIVVFKSDKPGQINGDAKVVLDVAGVTLTRDTDPGTVGISNGTGPGAGGSDVDAIKKYVDADIKITGNGTNEVGVLHTFTVEVNQNDGTGGGYVDAPTGHVDVTLTGSNGILAGDIVVDASSTCHTAGAPHVADNLAANGTCIVVFKSDKPGQINGDAKVVLDVAGVTLTRDTDPATAAISNGAAGSGGSDTDAIKKYVDADIKITGNGTNEVGVLHTFTVEVNQNTGDGLGYVDATSGHVDVTLTGSNGILAADIIVDASSTCHTAGAPHLANNLSGTGTCVVVFKSNKVGQINGDAKVVLDVAGVTLTRDTDPGTAAISNGAAGSGGSDTDAIKKYVDADIKITGNGTNEVGVLHTFTVEVNQNTGDGLGWVDAPTGHVDVTLTGSNGILAGDIVVDASSTCHTAGAPHVADNLAANGTCIVVFKSDKPGQINGDAKVVLDVAGVTLTRDTDPGTLTIPNGVAAGNTGSDTDAIKKYVDADIKITGNGTNEVGVLHTFTVEVNQNAGDGLGYVDATSGHVDVTLTGSNGILAADIIVDASSTCHTAGAPHLANNLSGTGTCIVVFKSNKAGQINGDAKVVLDVAGVTLTRDTDPATAAISNGAAGSGGSDTDAIKKYVDANITITPTPATNAVGAPHTFTVTVKKDIGDGNGLVIADTGNVDVTLTGSNGVTAADITLDTANSTCDDGQPSADNLSATGTCIVVFTSSKAGQVTGNAEVSIPASQFPAGLAGPVVRDTNPATATVGAGPGGSGPAQKLWIRTDVHDANHAVITTIAAGAAGAVVHDNFQLGTSPTGVVGGTVTFQLINNGTCDPGAANVNVLQTSTAMGPGADGTWESALSAPLTVAGSYSYLARYNGDGVPAFPAQNAACEPFTVTAELPCPAGSFTFKLLANGDLAIVYDQFPAPNDNSYGVNAVGWGTKGHTFGNLTGSDKAGFQLVNPGGTVVLDFTIDSISATTVTAATPSGHGSLGPFGGDGDLNIGTLTPADLTWDTAIARNLNKTGYFVAGAQTAATLPPNTNGANLLVDSPPTVNTVDDYTLKGPNPWTGSYVNPEDSSVVNGWDFHNTFYVTIKAAKLASMGFDPATWKVQPNEDELHNSPAKPCPCPTGSDPSPTITVVAGAAPNTTKITLAQSLAVNDNSYGTGTDATWGSQSHTFSNLLGSDKLQVVVKQAGVTKYDFTLDYISAKAGAPSGYGSLGPTGGDGSTSISQGAGSISNWSTSLDTNMNVACFGAGTWTTNSPTSPAKPECAAWDFVNSYTVTVNGTFSAADVTFPSMHNSPDKPNDCPTGGGTPGDPCNVTVTKKEVKDKQVKITLTNGGTVDAFLASLTNIKWPQSNGALKKVKLDGDVLYDNPDIAWSAGGVASLPLTADQNKKKIGKGSNDTLVLEFANNASSNLALYTATAGLLNCPNPLPLLP